MEPLAYCLGLSRTLLGYRRSSYLVDLVLRGSDGEAVHAHRTVLASKSSKLNVWLEEAKDQEVNVIIIPDMDSRAVHTMVEALYGEGEGRDKEEVEMPSSGGFDWLLKDLGVELLQKIRSQNKPVVSVDKADTQVGFEVNRGDQDVESMDVKESSIELDIDTQLFVSSGQDMQKENEHSMPNAEITNQETGVDKIKNTETEKLKLSTIDVEKEKLNLSSIDVEKEKLKLSSIDVEKEKLNLSSIDVCPMCSLSKSQHINRDVEILEAGKEVFKCCFCEWSRLSSTNFLAHVENHIQKKFTCDICFKGFSHKQTMVKHKKIHQKEVPLYTCDQDGCSYVSERKDAVAAHKRRVHLKIKDLDAKVTCPRCAKEMNKKFFLNYHSKTCLGETVLQCDICGKSGFVNKITLENHVKSIHSQLKLFNCEHCSSSFSTSMNLSTHRKTMHSLNKKGKVLNTKFPCGLCGKIVTSKQKLKKHVMVVHERKLNFACAYCNKTFSSNCNMMTHEGRVHTGILPHKCGKCDKMFSRKSLLEKHVEGVHMTGLLKESLVSLNSF